MTDALLYELLAERSIRRLIAACGDAVSRRDSAPVGELFTSDARVNAAHPRGYRMARRAPQAAERATGTGAGGTDADQLAVAGVPSRLRPFRRPSSRQVWSKASNAYQPGP